VPNHLHLLLRTGTLPIATVMRRLLTGYAVSFNRRHRLHGHLFQKLSVIPVVYCEFKDICANMSEAYQRYQGQWQKAAAPWGGR